MTVVAQQIERRIDEQLLLMAYSRLRLSVLLTMAVTVFFVGLLWDHLPHRPTVIWFIALMTVSCVRLLQSELFRRGLGRPGWPWKAAFEVGAMAAAGTWALGPVLMMGQGGLAVALLLVLAVLSVSAVASVTMATQWRAMQLFLLMALGPTVAALANTGDPVQGIAAAALLAAMGLLMVVGNESSRALRSLLRTEFQLAESVEETRAARERAEAASIAKTRFLANMSHELRTPLNAVIGAAQLLRSQGADEAMRVVLVDQVQRSGLNLLGLIEGVLSLARIEAGQLHLQKVDFDLIEVAESALASVTLAAQAKQLRLACVVDPALEVGRHGDAAKLTQLLLNLLGNAVKFTPEGEVTLRIEQGPAAQDLRFLVIDSGVGIPAADLPHIFEPFRQAEEGADRRFGGSGLGLTIARQLVATMGGSISVCSDHGIGSRFEVALALPFATLERPVEFPSGMEVWVAEPQGPGAEGLESHLRRLGCVVRRCNDPKALADADPAQGRPAKILVDQGAHPFLSVLRGPDSPIAAQDVIALVTTIEESSGQGVVGGKVLHRPVTLSALARCLQSAPDTPLPTAPTRAAAGNPVTAHVLVVEDDPLNQAIVGGLLRHGGFDVMVAPSGQIALELLQTQDYDAVLMDWQMPDMDGLEVVRRMRAGEAGSAACQVPVIALTANAFAEDRVACLSAGMNDFLTKPVLAADLMAALERWIQPRAQADLEHVREGELQEGGS